MNKYFISVCLFGLVACEGVVPAKPDNKEAKPPVKEITYPIKKSPEPKQPIRKVKKSSVKNIPYIYGDALYFWKTPQEDQKIWQALNNYYKTNIMTSSSYFGALLQELTRRNPENDAKAFLAKKQRFLLARTLTSGEIRVRTARGNAKQLFQGIKYEAIRKCMHIPAKKLQGDNLAQAGCSKKTACYQYTYAMRDYRFHWNRVMLKDCEKH